jgi:alpha-amylase
MTDEIYNKQLAYAYILTHEGYPTVYKDYEEWLDKEKMNNLIWIHNQKATGTTSILYTDNEYIARRNGYNGLSSLYQ